MLNCTTQEYNAIYSRWLENPEELLILGGYKPEMRLLDLCGGTGAVSLAALEMFPKTKKDITLLDLNPRPGHKLAAAWCNQTFKPYKGSAEKAGEIFRSRKPFDLVVCRQAVGYLELNQAFLAVAQILKPGGKFVFSSFQKPSAWNFKSYQHKGERYYEAHLAALGRVFHMQWRLWYGRDWSMFKYHSKEEIMAILDPWFDVLVQYKGRSLHWICTRRAE